MKMNINKATNERIDYIIDCALIVINNDKRLRVPLERVQESDEELFSHQMKVTKVSLLIGIKFGFDLDRLINIAIGTLLHDIGKSLLNSNVLNKPDKFTEDEMLLVQNHPTLGYRGIKKALVNPIVKDIVRLHHEKIDGTGYPDGLSGDKLPIEVQIVTVADVFDALVSRRVYKEPFPVEKAIDILKADKGVNQIVVSILEAQLIANNISGYID